jgi:hypothetical protein
MVDVKERINMSIAVEHEAHRNLKCAWNNDCLKGAGLPPVSRRCQRSLLRQFS